MVSLKVLKLYITTEVLLQWTQQSFFVNNPLSLQQIKIINSIVFEVCRFYEFVKNMTWNEQKRTAADGASELLQAVLCFRQAE